MDPDVQLISLNRQKKKEWSKALILRVKERNSSRMCWRSLILASLSFWTFFWVCKSIFRLKSFYLDHIAPAAFSFPQSILLLLTLQSPTRPTSWSPRSRINSFFVFAEYMLVLTEYLGNLPEMLFFNSNLLTFLCFWLYSWMIL